MLYRHETNRGLGAATRAGMEIAHYIKCDAFAKFDADLQHDINDIVPAVRLLIDNEADIVYASRFAGKIHYRMPLVRAVGNRVFTRLMRMVTGWKITDAQTGLMCFSRRYYPCSRCRRRTTRLSKHCSMRPERACGTRRCRRSSMRARPALRSSASSTSRK